MTPLLEQFLSESHEFSQGIGQKLMQLEDQPGDRDAMDELFRLMHTLKGNSGLFAFPEMTRVLHAGEDLLGMVKSEQIAYSRELADRLLAAMDFVMVLCGDIEATESIDASRAQDSVQIAESLRALMPAPAMAIHGASGAAASGPGAAAGCPGTAGGVGRGSWQVCLGGGGSPRGARAALGAYRPDRAGDDGGDDGRLGGFLANQGLCARRHQIRLWVRGR